MMQERILRAAAMAIALSLCFAGISAAEDKADFIGNLKCKMCHKKAATGDQWTKWQSMKHAKAYKTLLTDEAKAVAAKAGVTKAPNEAPECLVCHVTSYDAKTGKVHAKIKKEEGVQCETCHGPASIHPKDGMKFKMDPKIDLSAHIKRGDADMCKKCHNEKSPSWNPERYTLKDGTKTGFDFEQAYKKIAHDNPKNKKGE